jgi:Ca-activated chloride channel family protein
MNPDTRLTGYANGELAPADREAFERELAASPELQAELTATTALCDHLMKTLPDPAHTLTVEQRAALHAPAAEPARPRRLPAFLGALAACVAVALGIWTINRAEIRENSSAEFGPATTTAKAAGPSPAVTPGTVPSLGHSASDALITKEYKVSPKFQASFPNTTVPGGPATNPRAKEILAALGVTFPPGASAYYFPLSAKLVVRNMPANLDLIEKLGVASAQSLTTKPGINAEIQQKLAEAEGFYTRGSYDLAFKRAEEVLAVDQTNIPARRLMERVNVARANYAQNVYNSTRTSLTQTVESAWKLPDTRSSAGATTITESPVAPLTASLNPPLSESVDRAALAQNGASLQAKDASVGGVPTAGLSGGAPRFGLRLNFGLQTAVTQIPLGTESYDSVAGNVFQSATKAPLSTFSIDVDTASYANVRRFLNDGQLPPPDAVRLEELINYFPYALPQPEGDAPFSITTDVSRAPWNPDHLLARIALQGRDIAADKLPASNLVFLVDVSGSMRPENKLPLLKRALRGLVERLRPEDRVAIVVYAGSSGLALPSTSGEDQARILAAIDGLESGGSTNGAEGIELAYQTARKHFLAEGNNRVILCTDGDFNVGVTSRAELTRLIERERKSGVFLSVLGFGTGNVKDATMEKLADQGNGNYAYIDSPSEARKVLVEQMGGTLFTIAKDVKIQVEFNPATVAGYRLLGYENRLLAKEDFNDDTKDAGEIGAGHSVTALYEIVPAGQPLPNDRTVDPLKYQAPASEELTAKLGPAPSKDLFTVKLRFKGPDGDTSRLLEKVVGPAVTPFDEASADFRFASAVAAFGMKLRADQADAAMDWNAIQKIARGSLGEDPGTYRAEFLTLVEKAKHLSTPDAER